MQKILSLSLLTVSLCFFSCFKKDTGCSYQNDTTVAPSTETQAVKNYLDSIGATATLHSGGFYYNIISWGSGTLPGVCSSVTVSYVGKLINGSVFDQQTDALFTLGGLIPGWKQGLPLISKGGEIKLYIPPSLGYGSVPQYDNGVVVIPANSILIFDINLVNVQ
jgi:FKBP-type peptidyl-prolyl cis-trans isomerase FkpA